MSIKYLDAKTFRDNGYLQEANRQFFHPLGLALEIDVENGSIKVWDYRDDPGGIRFENMDLAPKAANIAAIIDSRMDKRWDELGYWIQPVR